MKKILVSLFLLSIFGLQAQEKIKFLLFTDLHHDLVHDSEERLKTIISRAEAEQVDCILNLGDLAFALPGNLVIKEILNATSIPKYHVIGNHDVDKTSKQEFVDFFELPAAHYSFDRGIFRFVVLDSNFIIDEEGNEQHYDHANYYIDNRKRERYSREQHQWLEELLTDPSRIYVILSHGPVNDKVTEIDKNAEIHTIIRDAHKKGIKIAAVFGGHNHSDNYHVIDGINYIQINSASYFYGGEKFSNTDRFSPEIYKKYPIYKYSIPYDRPLYAIIEMDNSGKLSIKGTKGEFVKPDPDEDLLKELPYPCTPVIVDRIISY